MTVLREAAQAALEALEALQGGCTDSNDGTVEAITVWCPEIIDALRAALAEPVQEPVVWADKISFESAMKIGKGHDVWPKAGDYEARTGRALIGLYTAPPQPQRTPLTEEEIDALALVNSYLAFARAIERAHGIT